MKIVIMDAQGGGIGRMLVEQLKSVLPDQPIIAVGTNAIATSAMVRAGADQGATGENAVRVTAASADLILGPIGLVLCDAMLGEITGTIACAVGASPAKKILIPVSRCQVSVAGCQKQTMADTIADAVAQTVRLIKGE